VALLAQMLFFNDLRECGLLQRSPGLPCKRDAVVMNGFSGKDEEILMVRASELEPETY